MVAVLGAVIIAATVAFTVLNFERLPQRVPIHFGIDGAADGFGPRWVVWLLVALQVALIGLYAILYAVRGDIRIMVFGDAILAICAWGQFQVVRAAVSGTNRITALQFWAGFGALLALGIVAAQAVR